MKKIVGKREFIQHTSRYLKWISKRKGELVITHRNQPDLIILKIQNKSFSELRLQIHITTHGDVNEQVLPGYDEWSS